MKTKSKVFWVVFVFMNSAIGCFLFPAAFVGVVVGATNRKRMGLLMGSTIASLIILSLICVIFLYFLLDDRQSGRCVFNATSSNTHLLQRQHVREELQEPPSLPRSASLKDQSRVVSAPRPSNHADEAISSIFTEDILVPGSTSTLDISSGLEKETYTYSPLLESEIRLLQIDRSESETGGFRANLVHLPLLSAQTRGYAALSYTWLEEEKLTWIMVDDKSMKIRQNVSSLLTNLSSLQYTFMWIDAICIDQSNVNECSAQVLRMRSIYAGAQAVIVATETGTTVECADQLDQILSGIEPTISPENQASQVNNMLNDQSYQTALEIFYNDNYWSRIWIVQEFAISHNLQFLIKNNVFAASKLDILLQMLEMKPRSERWSQARVIYNIRKSWQANRSIQFLDMLVQTKNSLCKRRHDRVYGLLGLTFDAMKYLPEPNYEMDLNILTVAMARSYIERLSLDMIFLAPYCKPDPRRPSWAVDFFRFDQQHPDKRITKIILGETRDDLSDKKPMKWSATGSITSSVSFRRNTLSTPAFLVGTIRSLGSARSDTTSSGFPTHDPLWGKVVSPLDVCKSMYGAILEQDYTYNDNYKGNWVNFWPFGSEYGCLGYSFVRGFLPSHGTQDVEDPYGGLVRWICHNRDFFTGAQSLKDCAKSLKHPFLHYGIRTWNLYSYEKDDKHDLWNRMNRMSETNMRLMCLDDIHNFGIGWAATGARLHDKVFLIPGCSSPVILRQREEGSYEVVGDAIVIGAMENEIWSKVKAEELENIEIV